MLNKEIKSLTGVRGIAALYVVIFHCGYYPESTMGTSTPIGNLWNHGYIAVDLFFILSGFVITLSTSKIFENNVSPSNYKLFIARRFTRIYPAYIVILIASCVFITHFHPGISVVLSFFLLSIFSTRAQILPAFWSLSTEWLIYFIFPFGINLITKIGKSKPPILFIIFAITYGLIYVKFFNSSQILNQYVLPYAFLRAVGAYSLGIYAFYSRKKVIKYYWTSDIIFIGIILCLTFYNLDVVAVLLSAILIRNISVEERSLISRFCSSKIGHWLGVISYSLYLIHQFILKIAEKYLKSFIHENYSLYILIILLVCITIAHFYSIYIELPLNRYFRKKSDYWIPPPTSRLVK